MSDGIKIITNRHARDVIDACQLTPAERAQFDYLDWPAIDNGSDSASFVRYRGDLIDLGEFMRTNGMGAPDGFAAWDGYASDSFFSGTLVRWARDERGEIDPEGVIIGRYYS